MSRDRRRRRRALVVPVTSMGDIAFLLIIFFILCSNFAKEAGMELRSPGAIDIEAMKESQVSVAIDREGQIHLQGVKVDGADDIEHGVTALLDGRTNDVQRMVMFKCDWETDKAVFEPVIEAISKAGGIVAAVGERRGGPRGQ